MEKNHVVCRRMLCERLSAVKSPTATYPLRAQSVTHKKKQFYLVLKSIWYLHILYVIKIHNQILHKVKKHFCVLEN